MLVDVMWIIDCYCCLNLSLSLISASPLSPEDRGAFSTSYACYLWTLGLDVSPPPPEYMDYF